MGEESPAAIREDFRDAGCHLLRLEVGPDWISLSGSGIACPGQHWPRHKKQIYQAGKETAISSLTQCMCYVNCAAIQILEKYFFTYQECLRKLDINFSKMFPHYQFNDFREDFESALMSAFLQVHDEGVTFMWFI